MIPFRILCFSLVSLAIVGITQAQTQITTPEIGQLWKQVAEFEEQNLPKSAKEISIKIYDKALSEHRDDEAIKAWMHQMKFTQQIEPDALGNLIQRTKGEISKFQTPGSQILKNMLAEMYLTYFDQHRWEMNSRATVLTNENRPIEEWDQKQFAHTIDSLIFASLTLTDEARNTPINKYTCILELGDSPDTRPTVYDFLINRSLELFNRLGDISLSPNTFFILNEAEAFGPANQFSTFTFHLSDSGIASKSLKLYQHWLAYRLKYPEQQQALLLADLQRLDFINQKSTRLDKDSLYLYTLLKLESEQHVDSLKAEVYYQLAEFYNSRQSYFRHKQADVEMYRDYLKLAHQYYQKTIRATQNTKLKNTAQGKIESIENPTLQFIAESVTYPNQPFPIRVSYSNIDTVYVKTSKLSWLEIEKHSNRFNQQDYYEKLEKTSKWLKTEAIGLPTVTNYREYSTELLLNSLEKGVYLITLSNQPTFDTDSSVLAFQILQVSGLAYLQNDQQGIQHFYLCHRNLGTPVSHAKVEAFEKNFNYRKTSTDHIKLGVFETDKTGTISLGRDVIKENQPFILRFSVNGDTLNTERYSVYENNRNMEQTRVNWFTDRAIYRPGQVVYFKGIVTAVSSKTAIPRLITDEKIEVSYLDANGQEIKKETFVTNQYGSFQGSFVIPKGNMNGQWNLQTDYGSKQILVEEYKRPNFQVIIDSLKETYKLDQQVILSGKALAYNGMTISGAKVTWQVTRIPLYRYWWIHVPQEQPIAVGESTTDAAGTFNFAFTAFSGKSTPKPTDEFTFRIDVTITDPSGESQLAVDYLNLGGTALRLLVDSPSKLNLEKPEPWTIKTLNSSLMEVSSEVHVHVNRLQTPKFPLLERKWETPDTLLFNPQRYQESFKGFYFGEADYYKTLPFDNTVDFHETVQVSGKDSYLPKNLSNCEPGLYRVEFSTTDAFKNPISAITYVEFYSKNNKKPVVPQIHWQNIEEKRLEPGSTAELMVGSTEKIWVLYSVEFNGAVLHQESFALNSGFKMLQWPVTEDLRGGFAMHVSFVYQGRIFTQTQKIEVPFSNKELNIQFASFRDKLKPGSPETWTLSVNGAKGEKVITELLTSMYDASLDQFAANLWAFNPYPNYFYNTFWVSSDFGTLDSWNIYKRSRWGYSSYQPVYDHLNWFDGLPSHYGRKKLSQPLMIRGASSMKMEAETDKEMTLNEVDDVASVNKDLIGDSAPVALEDKKTPLRTNFNETAFFYPQLLSDSSGSISFRYTVPDNLTKYRFQALAHSQQLDFGWQQKEVVVQKELMVQMQVPRFVIQNDRILIPCKIQNLTDSLQEVEITLILTNPVTGAICQQLLQNSEIRKVLVAARQTQIVSWDLSIPDTLTALQYKVVAHSAQYTDGEQKWIPVLSNKKLVTESQPLWIDGTGSKNFNFAGLLNANKSKTLKHHQVTLEFTANPTWYAVMAIPYLMETETPCTDQIFSNLYANQLGAYIVEQNPQIARVFEQWKLAGYKHPFVSALEQNQELKQVVLSETPWVMDAMAETEQKQRMALLFDKNQMENQLRESVSKLKIMQYANGAWPWFDGMPENKYITLQIVTGFGKLIKLGVIEENNNEWMPMISNALTYLDGELIKEYETCLKEKQTPALHPGLAQYLYMRSFFITVDQNNETAKAKQYFMNLFATQWKKMDKYTQALLAMAFYREQNVSLAKAIVKSITEHALHHEELGMYWKENVAGRNWYQAPIEFQSLMIEMYHEIAPNLQTENELKKWLLKNKQTQHWHSTKATSDAIYSLLYAGNQWISKAPSVNICLGNQTITEQQFQNESEPFSGYLKKKWDSHSIDSTMGKIKIDRKGEGISWGAMYWQYFENIDQVKTASGGIGFSKQLYIKKVTNQGIQLLPITEKEPLGVGSRLTIRMVLETDRAIEFVHIKDQRASAFEPVTTLSGYRFQGGLGFYQTTGDASVDFFIDYLPKGTFVLEYDLLVTHSGTFSSGIATIQSMYAPEFGAHSGGTRLVINP